MAGERLAQLDLRFAARLIRTAVKTANYTAAAGDLVPCDTTGGAFTVTLPTAPADGTRICVKLILQTGTNAVTIATGGSDVLNRAGGPTTRPLVVLDESMVFVYQSSTAIWTAIEGDTPVPQLDLRYTLNGSLRGNFGIILSLGDSWSQTPGAGTASTGGGLERNYAHLIAAYCGISSDEVKLWGSSGARASNISDNLPLGQGSGVMMRHHLPPHMEFAKNTPYGASRAKPALTILNYGLNDLLQDDITVATVMSQVSNAYSHGMRSMIAKAREARFYDSESSTIVYSGASNNWAKDSAQTYWPKGTKHKSTHNGDVATITLPTILRAGATEGVHVSVLLYGNPNAYSQVAAASAGAVNPTTLTLQLSTSQANYITNPTDNFVNGQTVKVPLTAGGFTNAQIQSKTTTVLTFTGAITGTVAATGTDVILASGATVTLGGTAANATGTVVVGGQGCAGKACHIVKRIAITNADAAATITLTLSGLVAGEEFSIGGWWIEDPEPPLVLALNRPSFPYAGFYVTNDIIDHLPTINANLATVAAEFDGAVKVVDVAAAFAKLYNGTWQAATGTGTGTQHITPGDPACLINQGSILRTWALAVGSEEIALTSAKIVNSGTDWQFNTVARAWTTAPDAGIGLGTSSAATNHAIGVTLFDCRAFATDRVHPSDEGHLIIAAEIIKVLNVYVATATGNANSGGLVARTRFRLGDGLWLGPSSSSARTPSVAAALDTVYCFPIEVSEELIFTSMNMHLTTVAGAGGVLQMGIWSDGAGLPGGMIWDSGDIAITSGTGVKSAAMWQKVMQQWVWFGWCVHVGSPAGAFESISQGTLRTPHPMATQAVPSGTYRDPVCLSFPCTTTGAGQALPATAPAQVSGGVTAVNATTPWLWANYTVAVRD